MGLVELFQKMKDSFWTPQTDVLEMRDFPDDEIVRNHLFFSGKVQGVGFRVEVYQMALRLELTGWVRNLDDGRVELEVQGMKNKIDFLVDFMYSIKRIKITQTIREDLPLVQDEKEFRMS